jgi:hypothetical protein
VKLERPLRMRQLVVELWLVSMMAVVERMLRHTIVAMMVLVKLVVLKRMQPQRLLVLTVVEQKTRQLELLLALTLELLAAVELWLVWIAAVVVELPMMMMQQQLVGLLLVVMQALKQQQRKQLAVERLLVLIAVGLLLVLMLVLKQTQQQRKQLAVELWLVLIELQMMMQQPLVELWLVLMLVLKQTQKQTLEQLKLGEEQRVHVSYVSMLATLLEIAIASVDSCTRQVPQCPNLSISEHRRLRPVSAKHSTSCQHPRRHHRAPESCAQTLAIRRPSSGQWRTARCTRSDSDS